MSNRHPPELEMNLQGEFVSPPRTPIASRVLFWAIVVASVAGALAFAAVALWVASMVLPIAIGAAAVAWVMYRYRMWRMQRTMGQRQAVWRA